MQEEQLLFISHAFNDIANEKRALGQNMEKITAFTRRQTSCRFIFLLQTHADASHGGLHYATEKTTDVHEVSCHLAIFLLTSQRSTVGDISHQVISVSAVVQRCLPFDGLWVLCGKTPWRPSSCCVILQSAPDDHVHS
jgi:hypothetical protein